MIGVLGKVGGLVALSKFLSLILAEYHRRLFEKEYEEKGRKKMNNEIGDGESLTEDQEEAKFKDIFSFENLAEAMKKDDKFHLEFIQDQVNDAKEESNNQKNQIFELQTTLKETEMTLKGCVAQMKVYEEQAQKHEEQRREQAYQLDILQQKVAQLSRK